jgi:phosphoribosyl-AMP cyclohydrolase / phosphoribosyl-ATP pyrophosphohydrolase
MAPDTDEAASEPLTSRGRVATPIAYVSEELERITFDDRGLVPAIVQDDGDGTVLMLGYMDAEAVRRTLDTGRSWFWSRSRQEYWCKGETSGARQWVRSVRYDCDGDALLVRVDQDGAGACHTGARSCFYRSIGEPSGEEQSGEDEGR